MKRIPKVVLFILATAVIAITGAMVATDCGRSVL
jgi:hypothetical protein